MNTKRVISASVRTMVLVIIILATCAFSASASLEDYLDDAEEAVITATTKVYQSPSTSSTSVKIKSGTSVNLLAVSGSWALIEKDGSYAYIQTKYVTTMSDYNDLLDDAEAAIVNTTTKVYQSASTSSASAKIKKGTSVNLLATSGSWALIEKDGSFGYIKTKYVTVETDYSDLLDDAVAATININTKVYQSASTSSASATIKKGTSVNLLATSGGWALIEKSGSYGFVDEDAVTILTSDTSSSTSTSTTTVDYSSLLDDAEEATINTTTKVYQSASTSSASATIKKGTSVNLLATSGGWALIERSGNYGFVDEDAVTVTTTESTSATTVSSDYLSSSSYTNEEKCYLFLTKEAGFNTAAACGILANIRKESNFSPTAGSSYYGLCQWGGSRLTKLKSYCSSNGYSYSTLEGQLNYLVYELKNSYSSVYSYLKSVSNSADGAYDAGYYFCYNFERPSNKASKSVARGELARDTYYPKYA